jgi:hypothetical protein
MITTSGEKPEEKPIKVTFGIQPHQIERIESERKRFNAIEFNDPELQKYKVDIIYNREFWNKLGTEFGWCPFTLCLHYFDHKNESGEKQRLTLQDELEILALKAFEDARGGNMNFWTMSVDDPEAVYWREVWKKGFLFRQEKSSQSLPIREKPDFEKLAELNNPNVISDKYLFDSEGHKRINPVWERAQDEAELYRRCEVAGMKRIWEDYVEPIR